MKQSRVPSARSRRILSAGLAASAIVVALAACGSGGDEAPAASAPPQTQAPTTTTTLATTTAPPAPTSTVVLTSVVSSKRFEVPFTVDESVGKGFTKRRDQQAAVDFSSDGFSDAFVAVTTLGKNSTDGWLALFAENEGLSTGDVVEAVIGGVPVKYVDVSVSPDTALAVLLFQSRADEYGWEIPPGFTDRIYLMEVGDEFVTILAEARSERFEGFIEDVDLFLSSLVWGSDT